MIRKIFRMAKISKIGVCGVFHVVDLEASKSKQLVKWHMSHVTGDKISNKPAVNFTTQAS